MFLEVENWDVTVLQNQVILKTYKLLIVNVVS